MKIILKSCGVPVLAATLVVFREVLEAALIIPIILAATKGLPGRGRLIGGGVASGILGACILAVFTGTLSQMMDGTGQEILNAAILLIAVAMLGWHIAWMSTHGKELSAQLKLLGQELRVGRKPMIALLVVVAMAVLREGSETVLFMQGLLVSNSSRLSLLLGGLLGLFGGIGLGVVIYLGLLRFPIGAMFRATNILLMLIAGGMAAKAANFLVQAGYLSELTPPLWSTSAILPESSIIGQALGTLVGYVAEPTGIQLAFYLVTLGVITMMTKWATAQHQAKNLAAESAS